MFLLRVCAALERAAVPFAIAGGYAVALHGAVRGTVDVDLVIRLRSADFQKAEAALKEMGLQARLPVTAEEVFRFREEYIRNRNLLAWTFVNASNPGEVVDILIAQDLARCKTIEVTVKGRPVPIVGRKDLIRMKTGTGRAQDAEDVAALEHLGRAR